MFSLCSAVSSLGTRPEHNFLKLRSSVTILHTTDQETSGNSNESGYRESLVLLVLFASVACIKSLVITDGQPERSSLWTSSMSGVDLGVFELLSVGRLWRKSASAYIVSPQTRCRHQIVRKRKHNAMMSLLTV
ncbi:hypothetical protein TNCV_56381 [Trichonephila clavipes]|nr:hypothetical protein TNCV_56381 [Trichonephila clavipes]